MPTRAAILGPTGYTGYYLIQLLLRHPHAQLTYLASHRDELPDMHKEFPSLLGRLDGVTVGRIDPPAIKKVADVIFMCVPHVAAMKYAPMLLDAGLRVIDLSADYRLRDAKEYETVYQHPHDDMKNLAHAVYGLPEFFKEQIKGARLLANPGCYPTASALGIAPFLRHGLVSPRGIVVNAASGVSGAGRDPKPNLHFPEANENYSAYNVGVHRHQPEISQSLTQWGDGRLPREPLFAPHLLPVERGILETIYAEPASDSVDTAAVGAALRAAYQHERFVCVRDDMPALRDVQRTNMVHVCARVIGGRGVVVAAEDDLVKGASGQAIQNANLMLGIEEAAGLS